MTFYNLSIIFMQLHTEYLTSHINVVVYTVSLQNVEATGKHYLLCVDVSRSMDFGSLHGTSQLVPVVAAVSMVMVIARTEPHYSMVAFSSSGLTPVNITSNMTIEEVCKTFSEV